MVNTPDAQTYERFGERLAELRRPSDARPRSLTQEDVARAIGVPRATYAQWERGLVAIPLAPALRLAEFFGVALEELTAEEVRA